MVVFSGDYSKKRMPKWGDVPYMAVALLVALTLIALFVATRPAQAKADCLRMAADLHEVRSTGANPSVPAAQYDECIRLGVSEVATL